MRRLRSGALPEEDLVVVSGEGHQRREGNCLDGRNRCDAPEHLLKCKPDGRRAGHHFGRQGDLHGQDIAGVETRIDLQEPPDALHHQSRAREQNDGEADFHDYENALRAMASASRAARAFPEGFLRICIGAMEGWSEAEEDAGDDGNYQGEEQDILIDADFRGTRQAVGRRRQNQAGPPTGEQHTDRCGAQRQQDAFRQQLAHDPSAFGAQRGANGELALARRGARQQQIGDISAGDDQDESDRTDQQQQRGLDVPDHVVLHADEPHPMPGIRLRVLTGQDAADDRHLGLRRFHGHTRFEPANNLNSWVRLPRTQQAPVILLDWNVDLRLLAEPAIGGQYADYGAIHAVQRQDPAEDMPIGSESLFPEPVAEHRRARGALPVFLRQKTAPEHRRNAEDREETRRNVFPREVLGFSCSGEVEVIAAAGAHTVEGTAFADANRCNSGMRPTSG